MIRAHLYRQSDHPNVFPLLRYTPKRSHHTWQGWVPALVLSASNNLPKYLVIGGFGSSIFSFLQFVRPGEEKSFRTVAEVMAAVKITDEKLAQFEEISGDIVMKVNQIFKLVTQGELP
jgi:hypothetical protein